MPTARQIEQRRRYAKLLRDKATDASPTNSRWVPLLRTLQGALSGYMGKEADRMDKERKDEALRNLAAASQITFTPTFVGDDTGVESVTADPRGALVNTIARSMDEPGKMMPFVLKTLSGEMASDRDYARQQADLEAERLFKANQSQKDREATAEQARLKREATLDAARITAQGRDTRTAAQKNASAISDLQRKVKAGTATEDDKRLLSNLLAHRDRHMTTEAKVSRDQSRHIKRAAKILGLTAEEAKSQFENGSLVLDAFADKTTSRALRASQAALKGVLRASKFAETIVDAEGGKVLGLTGAGARIFNNVRSEIQSALGSGNETSMSYLNDFARRQGIRSEQLRSVVIDMAFAMATSREPGKLTNQDVERAIQTIGAATSDPKAFRAVLQAARARTAQMHFDKVEAATGLRPDPKMFGLTADDLKQRIYEDGNEPTPGIGAAPGGGNPLAGETPDFSQMSSEALNQTDPLSLNQDQILAIKPYLNSLSTENLMRWDARIEELKRNGQWKNQ